MKAHKWVNSRETFLRLQLQSTEDNVQYPLQQTQNIESSIKTAEVFKKARKEKYEKNHYSCSQRMSAAISIILVQFESSFNVRKIIYKAISFIYKRKTRGK